MVASVSGVSSASGGVRYYENDGYYADGDVEHQQASVWRGRGAEALGLAGETVDAAQFKAVLDGYVPGTDRRLGRVIDGEHKHQPGIDITLNAPKSVSLAALLGNDKAVAEAHREAVASTLAWVEKNMIKTRMKEGGKMVEKGGQKMTAATFTHEANRNLDPHLHTHCVIANMVQGGDGKWRTMPNKHIFRNIKLIGAVYRGELGDRLKQMGCKIEAVSKDGRFELAGFNRETLAAFSSRRAEIEAALQKQEALLEKEDGGGKLSQAAAAQRAALFTRKAKAEPDRAELKEHWKAMAEGHGIEAQNRNSKTNAAAAGRGAAEKAEKGSIFTALRGNAAGALVRVGARLGAAAGLVGEKQATAVKDTTAAEAVAWAVRHLEERDTLFTQRNLERLALERGAGHLTISVVDHAIKQAKESGQIRETEEHGLTTDRLIGMENAILNHTKAGVGMAAPLAALEKGEVKVGGSTLSRGQVEALKTMLESGNKITAVQGYAGAGKTTMLRGFNDRAEKAGYEVVGLAPTASAADTLEKESGIKSGTLQGFLMRNSHYTERADGGGLRPVPEEIKEAFAKTALVVDESSLISTSQMHRFLNIADRLEPARVVLVGDRMQLDAVEAGVPFAELQKAGVETAVLDQIMRQRNPELRAAVVDALGGKPAEALERLGDRVIETGPGGLTEAAAKSWLMLAPEAREQTGVMAPTHDLRHGINNHIRTELAREGGITGDAVAVTQFVGRNYTNAEKELSKSYHEGDVVVFNREVAGLEAEAGDRMEVVRTRADTNVVMLRDGAGRVREMRPEQGIAPRLSVYETDSLELRAGDRMRWTANDKENGLLNSRQFEITGISGGRVALRTDDGRELSLDVNDRQLGHSDYAWNMTVHAYQGHTIDNVIAVLDSTDRFLTNQKTFYVEISRARDTATIITDDREALAAALVENPGEQASALEAIGDERVSGGDEIYEREEAALEVAAASAAYESMTGGTMTESDWENLANEHGSIPEFDDMHAGAGGPEDWAEDIAAEDAMEDRMPTRQSEMEL